MITVDFKRLHSLGTEGGRLVRILDMGCGTGRHVCEAVRYSNVFVIGADINFSDVQETRARVEEHAARGEAPGGWSLMAASVARLPFPDATFNAVICAEVLEHIPDDGQAVKELFRVLKPGGELVISVPRYGPERLCWALSREYRNTPGGHIRIYHEPRLRQMIAQSGLQFRERHYAHGLHSPYWWLKCLVGIRRQNSRLANLYHRLLVWDMMKKPRLTRSLEAMLNPLIGKSIVLYLQKV